jgi:hypothetical protein
MRASSPQRVDLRLCDRCMSGSYFDILSAGCSAITYIRSGEGSTGVQAYRHKMRDSKERNS